MLKLTNFFLLIAFVSLCAAKASPDVSPKRSDPIALPLGRVIDGDTFMAGERIIRLWGIDAPEKGMPYFLAAKLYLETILEQAPFSCYYISKDRYQRLIMKCFSEKKDIASLLVQQGVAKDYPKYSRGAYNEDEQFAKDQSYGIWAKESP